MKKSLILTTFSVLLSMGAQAEPIKPYLSLGVGSQDLEGIDGSSVSLIAGIRAYGDSGLFIGAEGEASLLNTKYESYSYSSGAIYDYEYHEKSEAKYSLALNIPIGYKFDASDKVSLEPYALVGYSMTTLKSRGHLSSSQDNYSSSELAFKGDFTAHGFKYGAGLDMVYDEVVKIGFRWTQANVTGKDLDDLKDKNLSMIVGYQF